MNVRSANCATGLGGRQFNRGQLWAATSGMRRNNDLPGLAEKIAARLALKSEVYIIHPAELRVLRSIPDEELRSFAAKKGWGVVRRLGGRQVEFYNDAGARSQA
jgi:hypothetical protein